MLIYKIDWIGNKRIKVGIFFPFLTENAWSPGVLHIIIEFLGDSLQSNGTLSLIVMLIFYIHIKWEKLNLDFPAIARQNFQKQAEVKAYWTQDSTKGLQS